MADTPTPQSNQKTKNSASEKRGSIVKSIDKLASSIATDEANSAALASASVAADAAGFHAKQK